jgi:hypothetical protein
LVDESSDGTFHLVLLLDDEETPADLRNRLADRDDPSAWSTTRGVVGGLHFDEGADAPPRSNQP